MGETANQNRLAGFQPSVFHVGIHGISVFLSRKLWRLCHGNIDHTWRTFHGPVWPFLAAKIGDKDRKADEGEIWCHGRYFFEDICIIHVIHPWFCCKFGWCRYMPCNKKVDASIWSFCCWQTSLQKPPQTCHSKVAETEGWLLNGVGRNMAGNQRGAGIGNLLACGARVEICWDDRRDDSICPVELRSWHFTGQDLSRWFLNSYNLYRTFGMCNCLCSCCIMVRVATSRRRS